MPLPPELLYVVCEELPLPSLRVHLLHLPAWDLLWERWLQLHVVVMEVHDEAFPWLLHARWAPLLAWGYDEGAHDHAPNGCSTAMPAAHWSVQLRAGTPLPYRSCMAAMSNTLDVGVLFYNEGGKKERRFIIALPEGALGMCRVVRSIEDGSKCTMTLMYMPGESKNMQPVPLHDATRLLTYKGLVARADAACAMLQPVYVAAGLVARYVECTGGECYHSKWGR